MGTSIGGDHILQVGGTELISSLMAAGTTLQLNFVYKISWYAFLSILDLSSILKVASPTLRTSISGSVWQVI